MYLMPKLQIVCEPKEEFYIVASQDQQRLARLTDSKPWLDRP